MRILAILVVCAGCAAAAEHSALVQCAGEATLKVLPDDPVQATIADVRDITARVNECRADGGAR